MIKAPAQKDKHVHQSKEPAAQAITAHQGYQALGRLKSGELNNTERKYAAKLEVQKHAGEILWWAFEPMNLRLAEKCFYRVDFMVLTKTGALEVHEVKGGYITDDSLVKIKVAAAKFPFKFIIHQLTKEGWVEREF